MQGKQLTIRDTGCTIRGYLEIMSQIFGSFNLPSRSALTSVSANAGTSDFAEGVADASAGAVDCKEFKYASKSDIGAADSDASSLSQFQHQPLALSLDVL